MYRLRSPTLAASVIIITKTTTNPSATSFAHSCCRPTIISPQASAEEMVSRPCSGRRRAGNRPLGTTQRPIHDLGKILPENRPELSTSPHRSMTRRHGGTTQELADAFSHAGLVGIHCEEVSVPFLFESAKAFAQFWFEGKNPAALKSMSGGIWIRRKKWFWMLLERNLGMGRIFALGLCLGLAPSRELLESFTFQH